MNVVKNNSGVTWSAAPWASEIPPRPADGAVRLKKKKDILTVGFSCWCMWFVYTYLVLPSESNKYLTCFFERVVQTLKAGVYIY